MARITLNKKNFFNNLDIISQQAGKKEKVALVLKDNAYGHGLVEIAELAHEYGISKVIVQREDEAKRINKLFEYVLVLADIPSSFDEKIVYTINSLEAISKFMQGTRVELKVNTGMNRNGIEMQELKAAFEAIQKQDLLCEAVFTHHGCADEQDEMYAYQKSQFQKVKEEAKILATEFGFKELRFHSANSAALFREKDFNEDMARVGIASYGCMQLPEEIETSKLKPILSLYASKISSRVLQSGSCVGYGATFQSSQPCVVTNYDLGYGDGFLRACSHHYKTPQRVKIVGRISMDNSSFLTDKEELLIFNDAREVAQVAGTISYEILTSLKSYLKREIV